MGDGPVIDHVVVLALENRSFDHMLGFLDHPNPDFEGLSADGGFNNPGWAGGAPVHASPTAKPVIPIGPNHSHAGVMEQLALKRVNGQLEPTNQGFVISLERTGRGLDPPQYGGLLGPAVNGLKSLFSHQRGVAGRGPLAMLCQPSANAPALSQLARSFVLCTRWFCSVPGETWPNRNFLHAATSDGETDIDIRFYENRTIFEELEEAGRTWRIYYDDTPQVWAFRKLWDTPTRHANWYPFPRFLEHVASSNLPTYSFIEPNHRPPLHGLDEVGESDNQHPENNLVSDATYSSSTSSASTDFSRADRLIASIYEALRGQPALFERTLLVVTYDEHGGFYDHHPPTTRVPSPGGRQDLGTRLLHALLHRKSSAFDFTLLGPRVPAVIVSPLVPAGALDKTIRDHASVPSTLRKLFAPGASCLTARDRWAPSFDNLLSLPSPRIDDLPDLSLLAATPTGARAAHAAAPATTPAITPSYRAFLDQAEAVHQHLVSVGETEALPLGEIGPIDRATQIVAQFTAAADRHRTAQSSR